MALIWIEPEIGTDTVPNKTTSYSLLRFPPRPGSMNTSPSLITLKLPSLTTFSVHYSLWGRVWVVEHGLIWDILGCSPLWVLSFWVLLGSKRQPQLILRSTSSLVRTCVRFMLRRSRPKHSLSHSPKTPKA